jgi:hypothetical protein
VGALAEHSHSLKILRFDNMAGNISEATVIKLLLNCTSLRDLQLRGCADFTEAVVAPLMALDTVDKYLGELKWPSRGRVIVYLNGAKCPALAAAMQSINTGASMKASGAMPKLLMLMMMVMVMSMMVMTSRVVQ